MSAKADPTAEISNEVFVAHLNGDLPDLPDRDLLAEIMTLRAQCIPFGKVPSSARMRRVLRQVQVMLETKLGWPPAAAISDPKRTIIDTLEEEVEVMERQGFIPVCQYAGNLIPEENEIGAFGDAIGEPRLERGLFATEMKITERVFMRAR